ncbi:hypothetical protein HNQ92_001068 [Rhabdobacter roseus]|uniref:Uncharacterized protein n=1 Tax=Rhabdobacter roseus TaxID=1655419 RepID=A0A840TN25_9BACT|nr:bZIP transcription factor [Rhabdobacter roseus]MBB5282942.1 hypothetical protein [Rhabdobacter roseus]
MKHCFTLPTLLVLVASATLAQNKIITPAQQPLVVGNAGLRHAALNASSPTAPWNGKVLSLDANGLMILVKDSAGGSGSTLWNASGSHINYLPGNVGIGTATPLQRLHVNGDINVSTGSGLRINNVPFLRAPGSNNTILGTNAGINFSTGTHNVFIGNDAGGGFTPGTGNTGIRNIFIGAQAGYSNTTGNSNISIGFAAGHANQTGSLNVNIGTSAGQYATGSYNFFAGNSAGQYATGSYNFYLGHDSGKGTSSTPNNGQVNVFIGYRAGQVNNGSNNILLGSQAGLNNSSGFRNVFLGSNSGLGNETGNSNTLIGFESNVLAPNLTNATAVGAAAKVSQSNSVILGSDLAKIGIGNTAPTARLHVTTGGTTATGVRLENLPTSIGTIYPLYVDANGNVMKASTAGARELAPGESNWERTAQDHLLNRNGGGVLIGSGFNTLPTGYQLYVSEGILTERIKVALKSTDEWRDNVFRDDYKLRPLAETEAFIKQHRHLPDVPSAEEMVQQGNDLHRTDALLLEKIEELTLYLLEVKKENLMLKAEGEEMRALMRQLAKEIERLKQPSQGKNEKIHGK